MQRPSRKGETDDAGEKEQNHSSYVFEKVSGNEIQGTNRRVGSQWEQRFLYNKMRAGYVGIDIGGFIDIKDENEVILI